ncbi:MAG: hypothetical protein FJ279_32640, partial [Planctomycetes bacterium]|nr:hypothetical protein [Planctomycetota bacterium]
MCDCYWPKCERCDAQVPLHISDFCMTRDEVAVFCAKHIPRRDAVVYEIVSEAFQPGFGRGDDFYHEPPKGWRMAVRYKRPPPKGYDLQAAEPNSASDYLAEYRSPTGARRFFGHCFSRLHRSERAAALDALTDIADRRERFGRQDPAFQAMLAAQQRIWESVKKQS